MVKLAVLKQCLANPLGRWILIPYRAKIALSSCSAPYYRILPWLARSKELSNFTYNYSQLSLTAAIHMVALVTQRPVQLICSYVAELQNDEQLHQHIARMTSKSDFRHFADSEFKPGRRLFYYLLARAVKPGVVVEAGLDKGLGACIIGAALLKNASEGDPGKYYGLTLLSAKDAFLFAAPYDTHGELITGDSVDFLRNSEEGIGLFIHGTTNDPAHERDQYKALQPRLGADSIVLSTWLTEMFIEFAQQLGLSVLAFHETPVKHWYPGGNIAFAFHLHSRMGK
ncbi:MAG TPA: class I SAM-dependent methyltransferase [Nitrospirota bacterium]|nr:class I SAM-dependent methyltransferase [Nitrospirota bacterium]